MLKINARAGRFEKPAGSATPAFSVRFSSVPLLNRAFSHAVNTHQATCDVAAWQAAGHSAALCMPLLYSIMVTFGIGHRVWGKYHTHYGASLAAVNGWLGDADNHVRAGNIPQALASLRHIKGLGSISYASKTLRFLSGGTCPVMDSVIMSECGYGKWQYVDFVTDCRDIAGHCAAGTRAADVESALFTAIQVNNPHQRKAVWLGLRVLYPKCCLPSASPLII